MRQRAGSGCARCAQSSRCVRSACCIGFRRLPPKNALPAVATPPRAARSAGRHGRRVAPGDAARGAAVCVPRVWGGGGQHVCVQGGPPARPTWGGGGLGCGWKGVALGVLAACASAVPRGLHPSAQLCSLPALQPASPHSSLHYLLCTAYALHAPPPPSRCTLGSMIQQSPTSWGRPARSRPPRPRAACCCAPGSPRSPPTRPQASPTRWVRGGRQGCCVGLMSAIRTP